MDYILSLNKEYLNYRDVDYTLSEISISLSNDTLQLLYQDKILINKFSHLNTLINGNSYNSIDALVDYINLFTLVKNTDFWKQELLQKLDTIIDLLKTNSLSK